jgi:hypothetical protein
MAKHPKEASHFIDFNLTNPDVGYPVYSAIIQTLATSYEPVVLKTEVFDDNWMWVTVQVPDNKQKYIRFSSNGQNYTPLNREQLAKNTWKFRVYNAENDLLKDAEHIFKAFQKEIVATFYNPWKNLEQNQLIRFLNSIQPYLNLNLLTDEEITQRLRVISAKKRGITPIGKSHEQLTFEELAEPLLFKSKNWSQLSELERETLYLAFMIAKQKIQTLLVPVTT